MRRLGWVWGAVAALGVLGVTSDARATCWYECELTPVHDDCSEATEIDDGVYEWEQLDELRVLTSCTESCCAPIEGGCGDPVPVDPPTWAMTLSIDGGDQSLFQEDHELSVEQECGGSVVVAAIEQEAGRRYTVAVEGQGVTFEAVTNAAGCRIGGSSGGALALTGLLLFGIAAGRRRTDPRA